MMADEEVAPTRAEIDAMLWAFGNQAFNEEEIKYALTQYLTERGVSKQGIAAIAGDLTSYKNYAPKEVTDAS